MRLPGGSDERQELEQIVEQLDEEYRVGLRETLSTHRVDTEDRTLGEVQNALAQALRLLMHPTAQARLRDAIEETERALTRLKEFHGQTVGPLRHHARGGPPRLAAGESCSASAGQAPPSPSKPWGYVSRRCHRQAVMVEIVASHGKRKRSPPPTPLSRLAQRDTLAALSGSAPFMG